MKAIEVGGRKVLEAFHPLCRQWFEREIGEPTEVQLRAWRAILFVEVLTKGKSVSHISNLLVFSGHNETTPHFRIQRTI